MKPFVTVSVMIHGGDSPLEITDYVDDNGRFVNIGSQVAAQLGRFDAIHFVDAEGTEVIIPYHAVVAYSVTKAEGEFTPADDAFCINDVVNNTSYTISFYNDTDLVGQYVVKEGNTPVYGGVTPTKDGYVFIGWNTDKTAETALEELPPAEATASYYAIFEQEQPQP